MITDRANTSPAGVPGDLRVTIMAGTFTIGAAGAITAQDSAKITGVTITKTGGKTARYGLLTYRPWTRMIVESTIIGDTDVAFGNTGANATGERNIVPGSTTKQAEIQGFLSSTGADTDFPSGTVVQYVVYGYGK